MKRWYIFVWTLTSELGEPCVTEVSVLARFWNWQFISNKIK